MTVRRVALFVICVSGLSTIALAQARAQGGQLEQPEPAREAPGTGRQPVLSRQAHEALNRVHDFNLYVIEAAELANENSTSRQVQSYGQMIVRDHHVADADARTFADERNIELATPTPRDGFELERLQERRATLDRLRGLRGIGFDEVFLATMAADHEAAIQELRRTQTDVRDTEARALFNRVLLMLQDHRNEALRLSNQTARIGGGNHER